MEGGRGPNRDGANPLRSNSLGRKPPHQSSPPPHPQQTDLRRFTRSESHVLRLKGEEEDVSIHGSLAKKGRRDEERRNLSSHLARAKGRRKRRTRKAATIRGPAQRGGNYPKGKGGRKNRGRARICNPPTSNKLSQTSSDKSSAGSGSRKNMRGLRKRPSATPPRGASRYDVCNFF